MLIFATYRNYMFNQFEENKVHFKNRFQLMVISIADTMNTYIGFSIIFHKEKFLGSKSIGSQSIGSYCVGSQA